MTLAACAYLYLLAALALLPPTYAGLREFSVTPRRRLECLALLAALLWPVALLYAAGVLVEMLARGER